ncbi:dentin sialophosphoprotein-like [Rhopilema esculentum]|uniref:dentin sialophosphoprotein-like n=1 Tax=Rhopilema esculentum TaxID=499914 RepID=UPI0031DDDE1C|eukprot:gene11650-21895_t
MEQVLADAKYLAQRLHHHDSAADALIGDASNLEIKLQAMKEYREEVTKLNDIAKHRPRSTLILGSQLENQRICDLENENRELHLALADHQSTLELIMNKYREQVLNLLTNKGLDKSAMDQISKSSGDISALKEKVTEMAAVMQRAARADEEVENTDVEMLTKLKYENSTLRELLNISGHPRKEIEKLKLNEKLKKELMVNGGIIVPGDEEHAAYSSGEELENQTGTVKRKLKGQLSDSFDDDIAIGNQNKGKKGNIDGSAGEESIVDEKVPMPVESLISETAKSTIVEASAKVAGNFGADGDRHIEINKATQETSISSFGEIDNDYVSRDNTDTTITSEGKKAEASTEALPQTEILDWGLKRRKQEEIVELYNSEGILLEEGEETHGGKNADIKKSGIKIRRSTKQKKVIQADLKSFFGSEDMQEETDDKLKLHDGEDHQKECNDFEEGLETRPEAVDDTKNSTGEAKSISGEAVHGIDESIDDEIIKAMNNVEESSRQEKLILDNLRQSFSSTESPVESPIESPVESPDHGDFSHRTVQLNYSDSDSDDPEMMVEDQFADIINDASDSDSSAEDSDDITEEELIGDLDEGGEYAMSRWVNPVDEFKLMENGDMKHDLIEGLQVGEKENGNSFNGSEPTNAKGNEQASVPDLKNYKDKHGDQDYAFSKAFVQLDQFTGGSIEAKFAKRKRYENGSRASAITLFSETQERAGDSARSNIRSDSELTTNNDDVIAENHLAKSASDPLSSKTKKSSSIDSSINFSASDSVSPEESSSGEIDPTVFKERLSALPQGDEAQSKVAENLTSLLSDLDAALELEDSD